MGSPGPFGPWASTLLCGPRAQSLCLKLGPRLAEAMGPNLIPLCSIQSPLGMQFYSVYLTVHYQRPTWPIHLGRERYCSRMLYLGCLILPWGISLSNVSLRVGTSFKVPKPLLLLPTKHPLKSNDIGPLSLLIT